MNIPYQTTWTWNITKPPIEAIRLYNIEPDSKAQSVVRLTADPGARKFESQFDRISFVDIDHEIISMVILAIPMIQEGSCQLLMEVHMYWFNHLHP